jgi:hypothetical protein
VLVPALTDPDAVDHQIGMRQSTLGAIGKFNSTTRYLVRPVARGGPNREGDSGFIGCAVDAAHGAWTTGSRLTNRLSKEHRIVEQMGAHAGPVW